MNKKAKKALKPNKKVSGANALKAKENPILQYGFGIDIYLKMMFTLSILFTVFTAISYPVLSIYREGKYYDISGCAGYECMSIGALGYSEQKCSS
jgi:hypothetical protein